MCMYRAAQGRGKIYVGWWIFSKPGKWVPLCDPTALWRRYAQTVWDGASSHNTDYIVVELHRVSLLSTWQPRFVTLHCHCTGQLQPVKVRVVVVMVDPLSTLLPPTPLGPVYTGTTNTCLCTNTFTCTDTCNCTNTCSCINMCRRTNTCSFTNICSWLIIIAVPIFAAVQILVALPIPEVFPILVAVPILAANYYL